MGAGSCAYSREQGGYSGRSSTLNVSILLGRRQVGIADLERSCSDETEPAPKSSSRSICGPVAFGGQDRTMVEPPIAEGFVRGFVAALGGFLCTI